MDIRVAAYAVITDDAGRILLAHWNEGGRSGWTLPGGGLDPGEDPERAAHREVREETGYEVVLDGLIGVDSRVIPLTQRLTPGASGPLHALRIVYRATVTGGHLRNETDGSTDRAEWFPLESVRALHRVKLVDVGLRFAGIAHTDERPAVAS